MRRRQADHRFVKASPPSPERRPRYEFDTERGAFYTLPSAKHPRRRKLDIRPLMDNAATRRDFYVRKDGTVTFRGHPTGWKITDKLPERLRTLPQRRATPQGTPPYFQDIALLNPSYELVTIVEDDGKLRGYYRRDESRKFDVVISREDAGTRYRRRSK